MKAWHVKKILMFGSVAYVAGLLIVLFLMMPGLRLKVSSQSADKSVSFVAHWDDVLAFSPNNKIRDTLEIMRNVPVSVIALSADEEADVEDQIRSAGYSIMWVLNDTFNPALLLRRVNENDGIAIFGNHSLEKPMLLNTLPNLIRTKNLFVPLFEFISTKLAGSLPDLVPESLIKGHIVTTRELLNNDLVVDRRIMKAVEGRWVRLVMVRFSPQDTLEQNLASQMFLADEFRKEGFVVDRPAHPIYWGMKESSFPIRTDARRWIIFLISMISPLLGLYWAKSFSWKSVFLCFISISVLSFLSGIVIHSLGSTPTLVLGIKMVRGIKLQLLLPLAFSLLIFLNLREIRNVLDQNLKVKHIFFVGGVLGVLLGVYLMRSGNFPLIPATDAELWLRDFLDRVFYVRPRFKEFLIGHPLLILGLVMRSRMRMMHDFYWDGRFVLWVGLIGQISILNTFMHFHAPFGEAVVRTFHGLWMGALVSLPLVYMFNKLFRYSIQPREKFSKVEKPMFGGL